VKVVKAQRNRNAMEQITTRFEVTAVGTGGQLA
jgi:hypothetical protein